MAVKRKCPHCKLKHEHHDKCGHRTPWVNIPRPSMGNLCGARNTVDGRVCTRDWQHVGQHGKGREL